MSDILVARLYDSEFIKLVIRELWDHLKDDSDLNQEDYEPCIDEDYRWYASADQEDVVGLYCVRRVNLITWDIHTHVRKKYWGSGKALPHAQTSLEFIFNDTGAKKIIATIPESSPQVIKYAKRVGFQFEGRMTKSFQKDGKVYDQVHLGITRK